MQTTPEFDTAFAELEGAAYRLANALDAVRSAAQSAARDDVTRVGRNLEEQASGYLTASERVGTAIVDAADGRVDEDAVARMSASIGLDLKVAEQLAVHARLEGSAESEEAGGVATALALRAAGPEDVAALDRTPSLGSMLSPVLHEIRGEEDPAVRAFFAPPVSPTAGGGGAGTPPSVADAIDQILSAGGTSITASVSAVATPDAARILTLIDNLSSGQAGVATQGAIGRLNRILHPLARAAAEILALVIKKITAIVGSAQLAMLLGRAKEWLVSKWNDLTQDNPAGLALGLLLGQRELKQTCADKLATLDPSMGSAVVQACDTIASAHGKRSGYVGWANSALAFAAGTVVGASPQGLLLLSLVGLALVAYSAWQAQDYLDAERFGFLPNRVLGVRGTVMAA
jgi:hypothetical protein